MLDAKRASSKHPAPHAPSRLFPSAIRRERVLLAGAVLVLLAGTIIRLFPAWNWRIWGSDSGEYYFLTSRLLQEASISFAYDGWGIVYPYFQAMFILTGAVAATTGLDTLTAMEYTVPAAAGVIPLGVLLITHRLTRSATAALVAGAFVAVSATSTIVTSHPMPGTLGHVTLLVGLLAVVAARRDARWAWLLVPILPAFTFTHHLSLYFFVGIVAGAAFFREMGSATWDRAALRVEVPTVLAGLALAGWWWLGVSDRMREDIVSDAFDVDPWLTTGAFMLALLALPALVMARRRLAPRFTWRPRTHPPQLALGLGAVAMAGVFALVYAFTITGVPGGAITVSGTTLAYLVPQLPFLFLAFLGAGATKFTKDGHFLWGWLAAILTSLALASATENRVLFPFRHVEYMAEALGALAGVGFLVMLAYARAAARPSRAAVGAWALLGVVIAAQAIMSYPPREAIGGFEEAMSDAEFEAVLWAGENLRGETIAADHRVSSLLFGFAGMRASWDYTPNTYHSETWEGVEAELRLIDIPSGAEQRIDYVFLSPEIRAGVTLLQWENSRPMTDKAWEKFFDEAHFEPVYAEDGVYIFRIKWENG